MTLTIEDITNPDGCNHINVTVSGKVFKFLKTDFSYEPEDYSDALSVLLRHFVKEGGWTTYNQIRTNLIGKEFKI